MVTGVQLPAQLVCLHVSSVCVLQCQGNILNEPVKRSFRDGVVRKQAHILNEPPNSVLLLSRPFSVRQTRSD